MATPSGVDSGQGLLGAGRGKILVWDLSGRAVESTPEHLICGLPVSESEIVHSLRKTSPISLVLVASEVGEELTAAVARLDRLGLLKKTVLILPFSRRAASQLGRLPPVRIVWDDELSSSLPKALAEPKCDDLGGWLYCQLRAECRGDATLVTALTVTFLSERPPSSVNDLARAVHLSASALRRRWAQSGLPGSPKELLDWGQVALVIQRKAVGESFKAIARSLGVSRTTLHRVTRRRARCTPAQLSPARLLREFSGWLLPPT